MSSKLFIPKLGLASLLGVASCVSAMAQTSVFSDEFNNADTLDNWSRRHVVENTPAQYTLLDTNATTAGHLTIVPTQTPGWFADGDAPLLFKMIDGNFSVHTRVTTRGIADPLGAPVATFNSAGLMLRDPAGATAGNENHIMVNVGRQSPNTGSETKNTINSGSQLILSDGAHSGELVLCRVGSAIHTFRRLDGDVDWIELQNYDRPDLPATLQVGMIANAFSGADLQAEFDFVRRLTTPATAIDCLPAPGGDVDGDSLDDRHDNCVLLNNDPQRDTDGDGFGNTCDADFNQDCIVNVLDLGLLRSEIFGTNLNYDMNGDGMVNIVDLGLLRVSFFSPPGP
ncbi:MAG: hypothetical protein AB8G16_11365, partial [Gammaproteobacteria bacterium]